MLMGVAFKVTGVDFACEGEEEVEVDGINDLFTTELMWACAVMDDNDMSVTDAALPSASLACSSTTWSYCMHFLHHFYSCIPFQRAY